MHAFGHGVFIRVATLLLTLNYDEYGCSFIPRFEPLPQLLSEAEEACLMTFYSFACLDGVYHYWSTHTKRNWEVAVHRPIEFGREVSHCAAARIPEMCLHNAFRYRIPQSASNWTCNDVPDSLFLACIYSTSFVHYPAFDLLATQAPKRGIYVVKCVGGDVSAIKLTVPLFTAFKCEGCSDATLPSWCSRFLHRVGNAAITERSIIETCVAGSVLIAFPMVKAGFQINESQYCARLPPLRSVSLSEVCKKVLISDDVTDRLLVGLAERWLHANRAGRKGRHWPLSTLNMVRF